MKKSVIKKPEAKEDSEGVNMNKVTAKIPAGFMELLPSAQIEFNRLLDAIRRTYELFGFLPIETPALEYTQVLLAKGGGDTEKQIYRFTRGDKEYCLHYDLTVPLARYVAQHYNQLTFPFRRYQIQKVWRAERPQKGRFREFYQCDVDVIGSTDINVDAEMLAIISSAFNAMGLGQFVIRVNNRKVLSGFLESIGLGERKEDILRIIDKLEKKGESAVRAELAELDVDEQQADKLFGLVRIDGSNAEVLAALRALDVDSEKFVAGLGELSKLCVAGDQLSLPEVIYRIDLSIARGLDYYTGTVFETFLTDHPEIGSVCSGGRYDNLASYYSSMPLPGVGISIGLTRLFDQLSGEEPLAASTASISKVLVAKMGDEYLDDALKVAQRLRSSGINTEVRTDNAKLGAALKYASKLGIPFVVIVGMSEAGEGQFVLRNMNNGKQSVVSVEEGINHIRG